MSYSTCVALKCQFSPFYENFYNTRWWRHRPPAAPQPIKCISSCRAHHRLKAKSFQNMVTYKKPKRGSITPPPPIVPLWGDDFSRASEGHDFARKKLQLKGEERKNLNLIVLYVIYILRSFWSFIYWFELLLGQFWWFSEVLTRTWNLRWRIHDGRHFGNNDALPTSCDVIRSCYELQKKDFWTCYRSFVVVA